VKIHADHVRLQFDDFILQYHTSTGWMLSRSGHVIIQYGSWDDVWKAMTTGERVRAIVFANQLR